MDVRFILENFDLKPDVTSLQIACYQANKGAIIELLVNKYGVQPDTKCMEQLINSIGNKSLSALFNAAKKNKVTLA